METPLNGHAARTAAIGMLCGALSFTNLSCPAALAQVSPAITPTTGGGNLGTTVTQSGSTFQITGGTRPGNGPNLFHSFGEFGVPANNIANFLNDSGLATSNILGRVTGGNPSNILGTIQTTGFGNANLFLMNPAGIVFGPNATLNVGGSVSFTTADYLRLADGAKFNAIPGPQDVAISSAPVSAFGFLGSNPAAITVQGGQLSVAPGQNISLIGGDITVQGAAVEREAVQPPHLAAPGGKISLASIASAGEVLAENFELAPNPNGQSFAALGTIQIIEKAVLDSSGDGGGAILIRGGRLTIDDSRLSANNTGPLPGAQTGQLGVGIDVHVSEEVRLQNFALLETNVTEAAAPGVGSGGTRIRGNRIEILDVPDPDSNPDNPKVTGIRSGVLPGSQGGDSGDIRLEANSITIDHGTLVSETEGQGNAGSILLSSTENIELINTVRIQSISGSQLPDRPPVPGSTGNIEMTSKHGTISMIGGGDDPSPFGEVTTRTRANSSGSTGAITVSAAEGDVIQTLADIFTHNEGAEGGGRIDITARNLLLSSSIISEDNLGPVKPDGITVTLSNDLTMTGLSVLATGSFSALGGPAADLNVTAKNVSVAEGSLLSSDTFRSGAGGHLNINADTIRLTDGGQISSGSRLFVRPGFVGPSIPTGPGGDITIQATAGAAGSLLIDGAGSGIFTNAEGAGAGGNLNLAARSVTIQNGGTISALTSGQTGSATGGNINISSVQSTNLNNSGSITASSTGPANAGNITINGGSQFMSQNGSSVTTEASQASGGNIVVQATDSIRLVNSRVSTSVEGGPETAGGNITIDPTFMTLQNSQVLAQANQGQGGNISITAGTFLADQTSLVSASSQFGLSGTVNIQSPVSSLSGTLATLPQRPLQVGNLLSQRCAAQASGRLSSLVLAGRDSLPAEPGGWLMSPLVGMPVETPVPQAHVSMSDSSRAHHETQTVAALLGDRLSHSAQIAASGCRD